MEEKFELVLQMSDKGIVCNAEQLKGMLPSKLKAYEYIVDAGNVKIAKEDRAKLNNMISLLSTKRKDFEDTAFVDWKKAKPILMDIEKTIKAAADALGNGIKDLEEKEKLAKMEEVRVTYLTVSPNMPIQVDFEKMYDRKAYDKNTMTVKKILEDIQLKIDKVVQDWGMMQLFITDLTDVEVEQIKEVYAEKFDTESIARAKQKADQLIRLHEKVAVTEQEETTSENIDSSVSPVEERVEFSQDMSAEQEKVLEIYLRAFAIQCSKECLIEIMEVVKRHDGQILKVLKSDESVLAWINQK